MKSSLSTHPGDAKGCRDGDHELKGGSLSEVDCWISGRSRQHNSSPPLLFYFPFTSFEPGDIGSQFLSCTMIMALENGGGEEGGDRRGGRIFFAVQRRIDSTN